MSRRLACASACCVLAGLLLGCAGLAGPEPKLRTRDELKKLIVGKTKAEVLEALGKPVHTHELSGGDGWVYERICYDPITGKEDLQPTVWFDRKGRVAEIHF